jgi:hypothetical protein
VLLLLVVMEVTLMAASVKELVEMKVTRVDAAEVAQV